MKVAINTTTFDILGYVEIQARNDVNAGARRRRFTKVKTLDGGIAVNDGGFTHGDRELVVPFATVSDEHTAICNWILENYSTVEVSFHEGVFLATLVSFTPGPTESVITLSLHSKLI